jgi:hypothetical protein
MDGMNCVDFSNDAAAQEASRQATLDSMNQNMEDDEVAAGDLQECFATRKLRAKVSDLVVRTEKRGLLATVIVTYTTTANIDNLGYTDPYAAADSMQVSLNAMIASGSYTLLVRSNGDELGSTTTSTAVVDTVPVYSEVVVTEVSSSSSSSGDNDDEETGIIIGSVIGGFAFLVIVVGCAYYFCFRGNGDDNLMAEKRQTSQNSSSASAKHPSTEDGRETFSNPIFAVNTEEDAAKTGGFAGL